eukprot:CAMPEP_0197635250 /NCGR_PEP_ID=MMETSP1338-20131121/11117_1 /TAXON_ID=43686 ORGANISM="Pelagodinium beii, Strain RCC1491" /NCGR_SAMPLE_ID=MMETSP1338 /ASSEMBLY_ACC=CAM_ASM_000754 /LENGTH=422 /DNA_ID=CAMNT_0043207265 /DNA_START=70 /DNA_END=1338 /DNA_ORIENTATION=+
MLTLTSTALGGGVLSVAYVMSLCGVGLGCLMLATGASLAFIGTIALMEMSTQTGCGTYAALFSHCAGPRAGPILDAMLFVYGNGSCVGYMVFIGDFLPAIMNLITGNGAHAGWICNRTLLIFISAVVMVPLVLPRDIAVLRHVAPASIAALVYMALVVAFKAPALYHEHLDDSQYGNVVIVNPTIHFFEAFSMCVFAYNCHLNVVPVAEHFVRPTKERIVKVSARVNLLQFTFYCLIGITGYLSFLTHTCSDIIKDYPSDDPFVAGGRFMLTCTMMVAIPMNMNPTIKSALQIKDYFLPSDPQLLLAAQPSDSAQPKDEFLRVVTTLTCLGCQAMLAVLVPQVGIILSLLGATVATAMMLIIPAYCMGIVLPWSRRRVAKQIVLYFFALVSVASVPMTILESAGMIPSAQTAEQSVLCTSAH